ncbi:MAG: MBL fold metallo-hydrolase [Firmicutes bacterium]|nr:MBL fold metallo-hydrolase [Bacillota bacterium]
MVPQTKLAEIETYESIITEFRPDLQDYYEHPVKYYLEPFQIFGNLYYVGDKKVCSHLVDTGDGLILFDTGYQHTLHLQLLSITKLGFDPADIKLIIHSHGHFDHIGGGNDFRELFGCDVAMGRVETDLLRENPERSLMCYNPCPCASICWPDIELEDGQEITVGNTTIRCILAPGHTHGTMAFFFPVTDGKITYQVGYWGGAGFLTTYKEFCRTYGLPEDLAICMGETIEKLQKESVDICLGNHPNQNCTLEKRQYMLDHPGENPFLDSTSWNVFLTLQEKKRKDFEAMGY